MDPCTFSTEANHPRDQRDAWSEWFQPVFDVIADDDERPEFKGVYKIWKVGDLSLTWTAAPAARSVRQSWHLHRNPIDHWVITCSRNGPTTTSMKNGELRARPGVPYVWSLGHVSDSRRTSAGRVQLYLPRDSFGDLRTAMNMAVGATVDGPQGAVLADYMRMLECNLPSVGPEETAHLPAAIQAMVGACLAPSPERLDGAKRQIELTLMERVRLAVRRNLRSPSLGPDRLCREAAMSRSQLYRVLEGQGGAAAYIQRCRLAESFVLRCDSSNSLAIGRVAELLCFADPSTFSRAFRREYGMSPSEARDAALAGFPPAPPLKNVMAGERSYGDWLRA
jgi:AraC-like DNA-binding protein